jgi:hypothetical protein
MRAVLLFVLVAGCIAAEPGKDTGTTSQRKACTELEGRTFVGGVNHTQLVSFVAEDAEYSTYTETTAEGAQSTGIAQCITANATDIIYIDGAIDHYSARADVRNDDGEMFLQWTDGRQLTSFVH